MLDGAQGAIWPHAESRVIGLNQVVILGRVLIFVDDDKEIALQAQAYGITSARGKGRAIDGLKAVRSDAEYGNGIGARVHGEQQRALRIDNQVLVGVERA